MVSGAVERAIRYLWLKRRIQTMRGLAVGAVVGALGGLLTHRWDLVAWLAVAAALVDTTFVFGGYLWLNLRRLDCEWKSRISLTVVLYELTLELLPRDGRSWFDPHVKACVVRDPTGREVRREGERTFFSFTMDYPELVSRPEGTYQVTWFTQTRAGRWLLLLRDHFDLDESGHPVGLERTA